ncbi:hypothetical protein ACWEP4_42120 [Streptomyces sp. NPDC004227]
MPGTVVNTDRLLRARARWRWPHARGLRWCFLFGGLLTDKRADGGDMTVVSRNVHDANPDPRKSAHGLASSGAGQALHR